ncbi:hypothetical protein NNH01_08945, partial [Enterococcus faecium]|nr:hypothetical protein [Enterococcus faecium]
MRSVHCQLFLLLFSICVPVISCFSNMLVNKNRSGKATTSPGNTALSNEIFTQKSIVLFNFRSVAFILLFVKLSETKLSIYVTQKN